MESHWLIQNSFLSDSISIHNEIFDNATIDVGVFDHADIQLQRI
jgi:hypothetical protein